MHTFHSKIRSLLAFLLAFVLVFGVAALVLLYFLGYYDFSFLDRYKIFGESSKVTSTETNNDIFSSFPALRPETEADEADDEPDSSHITAQRVINTKNVYTSTELQDKTKSIPYTNAYEKGGYYYTDTFDESSALAKMRFDFKLPDKIALSRIMVEKNTVVFPDDDSEPYVETEIVKELRNAVELYMGYILMDSGDEIYLIDKNGTPLSRYPYDKYSPAYMRDKDGNPVFMRVDGDETFYYTLAEDGKSFVSAKLGTDIPDVGLSFDFPVGYGVSDSTSVYVELREKPETDSETDTATDVVYPSYAYSVKNENGSKVGNLTDYRFAKAYAFTSNRATAVELNSRRGEMCLINENGAKAFANTRVYVNQYDRYVEEFMLPPMTDGIESMGFYYFDNGLMRVRFQTVDYYNYAVRGVVRVVEDYSTLIRADGTRFDIPAGFTLEGYSDGTLLLKKDGKYGFYSVEYGWIAQPIYASASPFVSGLAVLETDDGRFGMIDRVGDIVLPFTYDSISQNSSGLVAAYRYENGWTVFRVMRTDRVIETDETTENAD